MFMRYQTQAQQKQNSPDGHKSFHERVQDAFAMTKSFLPETTWKKGLTVK